MPPKFRRREKAVTAATKIAIAGGKKPHPETSTPSPTDTAPKAHAVAAAPRLCPMAW